MMRQHKLNFSNSPLNNSGEVIGFGGELGESLSPDTVIGASLLKRTFVGAFISGSCMYCII
jgi:hypothetical protein